MLQQAPETNKPQGFKLSNEIQLFNDSNLLFKNLHVKKLILYTLKDLPEIVFKCSYHFSSGTEEFPS